MNSTETLTAYRGIGGAAAAAAVGMVLGLGVGAARANRIDEVEEVAEFLVNIAEDAGSGLNEIASIPFNRLPIPVTGQNFSIVNQLNNGANLQRSFSQGGCDDGSIMFDDGICYPLLRQGPCSSRLQWITVDPISLRVKISAHYK